MTIEKPTAATELESETEAGGRPMSAEPPVAVRSGLRKFALLTLAASFFVVSVLGVLLPALPATPFLLLTSYFLVRSSPALNARLLQSRMFGPILVDWQINGGVRDHVRWKAIAVVVVTVAVTLAVTGYSKSVAAVVITLSGIGILVILKLPAAEDRQHDDDRE